MIFTKCKITIVVLILFFSGYNCYSQGRTHHFLLGYDTALADTNVTSTKARLLIDASSVIVQPETRKLPFQGAQANISDENGNLLMSTNGCWMADMTGDTMQNGASLNAGQFRDDWCNTSINGLPSFNSFLILPWPGDTNKYVLFHQVNNYQMNLFCSELYYSVVDISLNNGLGAIIQKNVILIQDTLNTGIAACKHANGRDWWIVAFTQRGNEVYKCLLTPDSVINVTSEFLNLPKNDFTIQPVFSPDGSKFAFARVIPAPGGGSPYQRNIHLLDFDRCSGTFSNPHVIDVSDSISGFGVAFSSNSQLLYTSSFKTIFQIDVNTLSADSVAVNDGYASPWPPFFTDFWTMYLAANGKIYISSGNGVIDLHYIDNPDISGIGCDVQQHALHLPCYSFRAHVTHPNYYLGAETGSVCDSLTIGVEETNFDFRLQLFPNPTSDNIKVSYLLPQGEEGKILIRDINGKILLQKILPMWSTMQAFTVKGLSDGIYSVSLISKDAVTERKLVVIH